ncbi:MAG: tetratricopeptide repeat protein [Candidatus Omnitrophica bacterium]|nr:tetratricopeptide repeat protein [Candidatus Omnitrophota bacterium]
MSNMKITPTTKLITLTLTISCLCVSQASAKVIFGAKASSTTAAAGNNGYVSGTQKDDLTTLQEQARSYRSQGAEMQRLGNLDGAMVFYRKAIELDPAYAVAYNDIGIILEASGAKEEAEQAYLSSIRIDPLYLSAYSNLALLYEGQRQLEKAAFYWEKRAQLGVYDDPWRQKARQRLEDIRLVLSNIPEKDTREQEVIGLIKDVEAYKAAVGKDNATMARKHLGRAKRMYNEGNLNAAIKEALDAQCLDPANTEIAEFIEEAQTRALSR